MRSLRWIFCVPALSILLSFPAEAPQRSAKLKIDRLEAGRWPPGGAVTFSAPELVALGMSEAAQTAAGAVSSPSLELRSGGGKAAATVDFPKLDRMRQGAGATSSDWLLSKLLTGPHEVSVTVQISSGGGMMTVHPTEVTIGGASASGATLDFVINNLVLPYYPHAVINRPFRLSDNIGRVDITPKGAVVHRK